MPRTGRPPTYTGCSIAGCDHKHLAYGLCAAHYKRVRRGSVEASPIRVRMQNAGRPCNADGCDRLADIRGMCDGHYQRVRGGRAIGGPIRRKASPGDGGRWIDNGYVILTLPNEGGRRIPEHRLIMERMLGRTLLPGENVHHRNGVKTDNRPENLELWVTTQPAGQRVEDVLEWAREVIARYS